MKVHCTVFYCSLVVVHFHMFSILRSLPPPLAWTLLVSSLRYNSAPTELWFQKWNSYLTNSSTVAMNSGCVQVRNSRGCLIPLNSSMAKNTKHMWEHRCFCCLHVSMTTTDHMFSSYRPHVLEVVKVHQHGTTLSTHIQLENTSNSTDVLHSNLKSACEVYHSLAKGPS